MRVSLTHKFVIGSIAVGAAAIGLPVLLAYAGVAVAEWMGWFVAMGAGGTLGFFLSRHLTRTFQDLQAATEETEFLDTFSEMETSA